MNFSLQLQTVVLPNCCITFFVPDAGAVKRKYAEGEISFPYWSQVWPAALALAQFLLQYQQYTKAKKVAELGAGLGLTSLVAAHNAQHVLCTDIMPEAVETVKQSAVHLGLQNVTVEVLDWSLPHHLNTDVLLLSDINYQPAAFHLLQGVIAHFLQKGTIVILSTPQRLMAKDFIAPLLADCIQQEEISILHEEKKLVITVVVLERKHTILH